MQTPGQLLPTVEMGTTRQEIPVTNFTASEMAVLRKSAAMWKGTSLPQSISARLKLAFAEFVVLRKKDGSVAGFGRDGFVLTPKGWGLYYWGEESQRQAHINW